jgi:hypothetical protein
MASFQNNVPLPLALFDPAFYKKNKRAKKKDGRMGGGKENGKGEESELLFLLKLKI